MTRLESAVLYLGRQKIITTDDVCLAFAQPSVSNGTEMSIRYTEDTLQRCAKLNQAREADWRLISALSLSLRDQRRILGTDRNNQPCFYNHDWWMSESEDSWANSQPKSGYYLIDLTPRFYHTSWYGQKTKIAEMGSGFKRVDERVFSQALISIFKTHGERLHAGAYHWGRAKDSFGYRIYVGHFNSGGLFVGHGHPLGEDYGQFVCVGLKTEF